MKFKTSDYDMNVTIHLSPENFAALVKEHRKKIDAIYIERLQPGENALTIGEIAVRYGQLNKHLAERALLMMLIDYPNAVEHGSVVYEVTFLSNAERGKEVHNFQVRLSKPKPPSELAQIAISQISVLQAFVAAFVETNERSKAAKKAEAT